jgi:hypothetical protein
VRGAWCRGGVPRLLEKVFSSEVGSGVFLQNRRYMGPEILDSRRIWECYSLPHYPKRTHS